MSISPDELAGRVTALEGTDDFARLEETVRAVTTYVRAYVRDNGFNPEGPNEDLATVIVTATRRLLNTQEGVSESQSDGQFSFSHGKWEGFTLWEQAALHRYRKRAM